MHETTHAGLTMQWCVSRSSRYNAANPFCITGFISGNCRMSHAISAHTAAKFERCEKRVKDRLEQIAKEETP